MDTKEYNQRYEENLQRIRKLRLFDDAFFTKCFEGNTECTELLLHIILEKPDLRVEEVTVQYTIKNLQGRSVRLDILAVDSAGQRYNIEVERDDRRAGARRARYNISIVDANILLSGDDPENLQENYVIFITEHDVLGGNKAVYHVDRTIRETGSLFGDGSHILYVNGACRDESPIGRLMHDFSCTEPDDINYALLADRVRYFKENKEGAHTMGSVFDEYAKEITEEVTEKVTKEVTKKVTNEVTKKVTNEVTRDSLLTSVKALMQNLNFTAEQAMDALNVPVEYRNSVKSGVAAP